MQPYGMKLCFTGRNQFYLQFNVPSVTEAVFNNNNNNSTSRYQEAAAIINKEKAIDL
jgi:hypothetical protein